MRSRIKLGARGSVVACVALVVLFAIVAVAGAKPKHKPPFKPKTGDYVGKLTIPSGESATTEGTVEKISGKYFVELSGQLAATCGGTTTGYPLSIRGLAEVKEKAFKFNGKIPNPFAAGASSEIYVKISGHFTSVSTLEATASAETKVESGNSLSAACKSETVKIKLKLE